MTELDIKEYNARLERFDWHWEYSEDPVVRKGAREREEHLKLWSTLSPQHTQLWQGYCQSRSLAHQIEPNTPGRAERIGAPRLAAQLATGVITQAELDAQAQQKRERQKREEERERHELIKFDELCHAHDWFYWHEDTRSAVYVEGARERRRLLEKAPAHLCVVNASGVYVKLFRAWADFRNAERIHVNFTHVNSPHGDSLEVAEHYKAMFDRLQAIRAELELT